jgi:hypothetical protein
MPAAPQAQLITINNNATLSINNKYAALRYLLDRAAAT